MLALIDKALQDFLSTEISKLKTDVIPEFDVDLRIPSKSWVEELEDESKINLYLFDVKENTQLRQNEWDRSDGNSGVVTKQKPPVRMDLYYMITFYCKNFTENYKNELMEHHLLSYVLAIVYDYAFIPENPYLQNNLSGISPVPKIPIEAVHPKFLEEQGGFQIWSALEQSPRPAVYIKVTVPIELKSEFTATAVLAKILKYETPLPETFFQLGGIVTDNASEVSPISGADVNLLDSGGNVVDTKSTDKKGKFLFKSVVDDNYTIKADAEGFQKKTIVIDQVSNVEKDQLIIKLETS